MPIPPSCVRLYDDLRPHAVDLAPSDKGTWFRKLVQGEAEINPDPPLRTNEWPVFEAREHDYFVVDPFSGEPDTVFTRYQIDRVAGGFREMILRLLNDDVTFYLRRRW